MSQTRKVDRLHTPILSLSRCLRQLGVPVCNDLFAHIQLRDKLSWLWRRNPLAVPRGRLSVGRRNLKKRDETGICEISSDQGVR
jgi:hypothetical protein